MISKQVQSALLCLQARTMTTSDVYELDRLDRAMDEILRNPHNTSPAAFQIRSARANAAKVLNNRRELVTTVSMQLNPGAGEQIRIRELPINDPGYGAIELQLWIAGPNALTASDRELLLQLAAGEDAQSLAASSGRPLNITRQRVSRARRAARDHYREGVAA